MSIKVIYFSTYLTSPPYSPADYDSMKFIDAIKGDSINKYASIPVRGKKRHLDNSTSAKVFGWFGEMVTDYFQKNSINPPVTLVPVPSSKATAASISFHRTNAIATEIANKVSGNVTVRDVLRWKKEYASARSGGPRDPLILYNNLKIAKPG